MNPQLPCAMQRCLPCLLLGMALAASAEEPQYGGSLNVGTVLISLSPLSWDPADWAWKINHDTGAVREQLFAGDLEQSVRKGGRHHFTAESYLPPDAWRGELAESWQWEDPLTLVVRLRRGPMFPEKPGVMRARPLRADDVLFSFDLINNSPRRTSGYFDHIERLEVRDDHTLAFRFKHFHAEWAYRFGYGYHSGISPREYGEVDAKDWRNLVGSGPFQLTDYVRGHAQRYGKNPDYWDKEPIDGELYAIPFVDEVIYRIIKDEATWLTALRTGKLDILEVIRWIAVEHLRETTPELQWRRYLASTGQFVALRVDQKPFDDLRVRRAVNLAVNQRQIVELFYGGHAELMAYPQHPEYRPYYQPLAEMPPSVRELFGHDPDEARRLLREAGYPDGFSVAMQVCACNPEHMELAPLLADHLAAVGVRLNIEPMEYGAFLSVMTTDNHGPAYLMSSGHVNPTTTLRKSFKSGQLWNPARFSDPQVDRRIDAIHRTRDEAQRVRMVRALTLEMLDRAPYLWLPVGYYYSAWWPWVRNYGGELRVGAQRPGPIYARIWIDRKLKRSLGFD